MTNGEYKIEVFDFLKDFEELEGVNIIKFKKIIPCKILPNEKAIPYFLGLVKQYNETRQRKIIHANQLQIFKI